MDSKESTWILPITSGGGSCSEKGGTLANSKDILINPKIISIPIAHRIDNIT